MSFRKAKHCILMECYMTFEIIMLVKMTFFWVLTDRYILAFRRNLLSLSSGLRCFHGFEWQDGYEL
jgi:hypothetical protein